MMIINTPAQVANQAIIQWSKETDKLVVGVDGPPGVGKTTLAADLVKLNPNILAVSRDDFVIDRSEFEQLLDQAKDRTLPFEFDMIDLSRFRKFVETYKNHQGQYVNVGYNRVTGKVDVKTTYDFSKPIVLIDGVFLFHPQLSDDLWDRRIFLTGHKQVVSERRVAREKARWGKDYFPEDHPDSYFRLVMQAFDRYGDRYHPDKRADLVLNMTHS